MDKTIQIDELLRFFHIDDSDLEILASLEDAFARNADALVEDFYRHLLQFPVTAELLRAPELRDRLLRKQREYLLSLSDPKIDADYLASRERIGTTHVRVGLETRWYLGAYSLYYSLLMPILVDELGGNPNRLERAGAALAKRLMLDAEIAIRQYIVRREDDLRHLNQELQSASQALTREFDETTRNLRDTRERARAAEQLASVATLVTGLAHEVGTPMGVIRGHAEALEGSVEGEREQWRLRMILDQIDRITSIIQSLLNIAKPKASLRVDLDLPELLEMSLAFLTEKMRRRRVQPKTDLGPVPSIVGDPERMQQIFLNLFINAIDAMPDGGTLHVGLAREEGEAVIRVRDTGAGIPAEMLENIFEPFFTTKAAGRGNGLGLVVVQGIVNDHGGKIGAHSEPGEGTEFEIRLPIPSGATA